MDELNQRQIDLKFLNRAVRLSLEGMTQGKGGPFGCVIVRENQIVGQGFNQVTSSNDPTAHAEVTAIRDACRNLGTFHLKDCIVYTSCQPCPMCLGAIYWSNAKRVVFANTRENAANIQFDDKMIYQEIGKEIKERKIQFEHVEMSEALQVFEKWANNIERIKY